MNAGGSEKGRHFAAKHCDVAFVLFNPADLDGARRHIAAYRDLAREEYGRDLQIWCASYVVQRETEREARDFYNYYVHEKGDWVAVNNLVEDYGLEREDTGPRRDPRHEGAFHRRLGRLPLGRQQ